MGVFEDLHRDRITGSLAMFDRMIFKGRLTGLYKENGACCPTAAGRAASEPTAQDRGWRVPIDPPPRRDAPEATETATTTS